MGIVRLARGFDRLDWDLGEALGGGGDLRVGVLYENIGQYFGVQNLYSNLLTYLYSGVGFLGLSDDLVIHFPDGTDFAARGHVVLIRLFALLLRYE